MGSNAWMHLEHCWHGPCLQMAITAAGCMASPQHAAVAAAEVVAANTDNSNTCSTSNSTLLPASGKPLCGEVTPG
jgi:hypothetical protein